MRTELLQVFLEPAKTYFHLKAEMFNCLSSSDFVFHREFNKHSENIGISFRTDRILRLSDLDGRKLESNYDTVLGLNFSSSSFEIHVNLLHC